MNAMSIIMAVFSVLGAVDLLIGKKFGIGEEFERGLKMFGTLALAMIGMLVLLPAFTAVLKPLTQGLANILPIEPSVLTSMIFACDMGGAPLALELASSQELGYFNGLVIGSMMGATVSMLPVPLGMVQKSQQRQLLLGILCGICTIPIGCIVSGLMAGIPILTLLWDLIPLFIFSAIIVFGLLKFPNASVKIFRGFGFFIKLLVTVGLAIGILEFLVGKDFIPYTAPINEGVEIVFSICAVMTGAFPLIYILSKILNKPFKKLSKKVGINETAALGFMGTLATSISTYEAIKDMDERGAILNSAFTVSAAYTVADHLAYTMAFKPEYVFAVMLGKFVAGVAAVLLAWLLFCRKKKENKNLS